MSGVTARVCMSTQAMPCDARKERWLTVGSSAAFSMVARAVSVSCARVKAEAIIIIARGPRGHLVSCAHRNRLSSYVFIPLRVYP